MPNNYVLLERIELNTTAASVTFDNIPQTGYTDLKLVASTRADAAGVNTTMGLQFNGDTGANYSRRQLYGTGSAAGSDSQTSMNWIQSAPTNGNGSTANTFSSTEFYIPNAFGATAKSVSNDSVQETNAATAYMGLMANLWTGTASISSIKIITQATNFLTGSTFSLYGIAKSGTTPAVAPKADGGNVIATDGTYWYHAFLSSGTFTPQTNLSADVLVVAGGAGGSGGGGTNGGGGGGAGGKREFTSQALSISNSYAVTVGAGGAAGATIGASGSASSITGSGLTSVASTGGGGGGINAASNKNGTAGGSGGGAGATSAIAGTGGAGNTGGYSPVEGYAGGNGSSDGLTYDAAGGGGGGGGVGAAATSSTAGNGGVGSYTTLTDAMGIATSTGQLSGGHYYYAGGAGGGSAHKPKGTGGLGGGGNGAGNSDSAGTAGTPNTGGGGGGGNHLGSSTAAGGSGIVIIRYPIAS